MHRRHVRLLILVAAIATTLTPALGLPDPGEEWIELRTNRFVVYTNADSRKATKQLLQFEQFRATLERNTGGLRLDSDIPTYIYIFRNQGSMKAYEIETARAYHVAARDGYYIGVNIRPATGGRVRDNPYTLFPNRDIYHEYVHFALKSSFSNVPGWLHEGLAEYYSTFWSSSKQAEIGRPIVFYVKNLDRGGLLPQDQLMTLRGVPHGGSVTSLFYGQSWATVHYLLHGNEQRREQFFEYFNEVTLGTPLDEAFSTSFDISFEKLQQEIRGYLHMRSLGHAVVPAVPLDPDARIVNTTLTRDATCFRLGMLLLAIRNDPADAEQHFLEALRVNPEFRRAHYGLGMVELRRKNIDAAIAQFQQATSGESDNAMEYLALGEALIRQSLLDWAAADATAPDNPVAAERAFERSLELQPRLASATTGLGRTRLLEQPYRPGAEKQLEQLWESHPTRMEIPVTTASMHFRNADRSRALGNLRHAASLSPRPLLLELVREALDLVNLASWNLPPYAKAMEDCLRAVASFRTGAQGKELQAKLTGDDEEMQQLGIYLDAATEYLEALRLAKGDKRDAALDTLRSMSERPAPFAEAAGALIDGLGAPAATEE